MAQVVTVDDRDTSRIHYAGGIWFTAGSSNEYAGTTHGTRAAGTRATFVFTGSSVKVYGTVPEAGISSIPPISTYSVDGSTAVTFAPSIGSAPLYKTLFYASPPLQDGEHTLVITSTVKDCYFWLDYIEYTPTISKPPPENPPPAMVTTTNVVVTTPPSTPPPSSPPTTTVASDKPKDTITAAPSSGAKLTPSNSVDAPKSPSGSKQPDTSTTAAFGASEMPSETSSPLVASGSNKVPMGAIVGAVVGGVIILLVLLFLVWRCRRKAATRHSHNHIETSAVARLRSSLWNRAQPTTGVTPFSVSEKLPFSPPGATPRAHGNGTRSTSAGMGTPMYNYNVGYVGGTPVEKSGLHSPTVSHSRSLGDSATGLVRDPSEASSQYGGSASGSVARLLPYDQPAGPSYMSAPQAGHHFPPPQSYGASSLYNALEEDTPPAYQRIPDGPNNETG